LILLKKPIGLRSAHKPANPSNPQFTGPGVVSPTFSSLQLQVVFLALLNGPDYFGL